MSLRNQINLKILLISSFILILGSSITLWQARQAIHKEIEASIQLALQLINLGIENKRYAQSELIAQLKDLKQTRHLNIHIKTAAKQKKHAITHTIDSINQQPNNPPMWFINLVISHYPQAEYNLKTIDNKSLILIIYANPMDEIVEIWHESITFISILLSLIILTFIAVQLSFNKALLNIKQIIQHLNTIEKGHYPANLPVFSTREYNQISQAINHMCNELQLSQQQNRKLTQHSLSIQEDERRRLSQELHDEFGQSLTAIKVMAATAAHEKSDTQQISHSINDICEHLINVMRSMMKQLHPLMLKELGLKTTLEDLINHWQSRIPKIHFNLIITTDIDNLPANMPIQLFRIIQEALTNTVRHAEATEVTIYLNNKYSSQTLQLNISDNGKGCELEKISGFGLQGMQERIELLNGKLAIQSQLNQGLHIEASIPIQKI